MVRGIVLRQLSGADRSRAQLEAKLAERGADPDVAARVLDRFEQVGLVDDAAFAQSWVRSRHEQRGLSRRALTHELRGKGVDEDLAAAAVLRIDDEDERAAAARLVRRRLGSVQGLPRDKQLSRLLGLLARRGYGSGLAAQVVREELAAALPGAEPDEQVDEHPDEDADEYPDDDRVDLDA